MGDEGTFLYNKIIHQLNKNFHFNRHLLYLNSVFTLPKLRQFGILPMRVKSSSFCLLCKKFHFIHLINFDLFIGKTQQTILA